MGLLALRTSESKIDTTGRESDDQKLEGGGKKKKVAHAVVVADTLNLLTPNDPYMGRTATLTSKRCILYIYSTNISTEYFKHVL